MFEAFYDDGLNPRFVFLAPVFLDELDHERRLPHDHLAAKISGAVDAFHIGEGRNHRCRTDEVSVVRDIAVEYLNDVRSAGNLRVDVWLERLDGSSCTYGFLCSSEDQRTPHARGERTIMKLDPDLRRPSTWSEDFVQEQSKLVRSLHSYA